MKASICEIVELFSMRYEEDFVTLPEFIQTSWTLLTTLGLEQRNDIVRWTFLYLFGKWFAESDARHWTNVTPLRSLMI